MTGSDGLSLAAAPVFAALAVAAALGGPADALCTVSREASPLSSMAAMYAAMAAFHLGPWLRLIQHHGGLKRA